jgi:hypothetical protein
VAKGRKQPVCRICRQRPPWRGKNCPPGVCKRCYHAHVWPERPAARTRRAGPTAEIGGPGAGMRPMVYDGYVGRFVPAENASFDVESVPDAVVELPRGPDQPERRRSPPGRRRSDA